MLLRRSVRSVLAVGVFVSLTASTAFADHQPCVPEATACAAECAVCQPMYKMETHEYTVPVFAEVPQQGIRKTAKVVPAVEMREVCEDQGHWEERPAAPCGACAPAGAQCQPDCQTPCTCKVWVPKLVTKQVPFSYWKTVMVEEPEVVPVMIKREDVRSYTVLVPCGCQQETAKGACQ